MSVAWESRVGHRSRHPLGHEAFLGQSLVWRVRPLALCGWGIRRHTKPGKKRGLLDASKWHML
jgi:hypothetical protein